CTGTLAALNAALARLTYTPAPFFDGPDALTLTTSDLVAPELGGPGTATSRVAITVVDVVNPPDLTVRNVAGNEGQAIPLLIQASTLDKDGSETLSLWVSGVPAPATLAAAIRNGSGSWPLPADPLSGLTLSAPDNFTVPLTATATPPQGATGATAATTRTLLVTVANVAPTAALGNDGPLNKGGSVRVFFTGPSDPSPADTDAGFRYSFALKPGDLATSYAAAGAGTQQHFTFDQAGTYTVYGRVFDKDGGFTDYTIPVTVHDLPPPPALPPPTDTLPPALPPPAVPVPLPQPTAPGIWTLPRLSSGPEQDPGQVGGDTQAGDPLVPPGTEPHVEFGSSFAGSSSFEPPTVSPVLAVQASMLTRPPGAEELHRAPPGPEVQTILQGNQVLSPHLDGDDSVRVLESLLPGNDEPAPSGRR